MSQRAARLACGLPSPLGQRPQALQAQAPRMKPVRRAPPATVALKPPSAPHHHNRL